MLFSSPVFLFQFLPIVLLLHTILGRRFRNGVLLVASLLFYAWGEALFVGIMLLSIACNYAFGLLLERTRERPGRAKLVLGLAIAFDLGLLVAFKYANWLWAALCSALGNPEVPLFGWPNSADVVATTFLTPSGDVRLPIGISFFTFQAMSYVIDVYRGQVGVQRNLFRFALYVALFPQLIAGPIVRYKDIASQLASRVVNLERLASGARRFVIGLGKKMLIANSLAVPADSIFALPAERLPLDIAWLGVVCYSLQIYYDFSGYSDMAIGLGRMLGFDFLENFRHPYIARSITEFWRRWHISLSTWFRDYLYIPLGGNRLGTTRTAFNLVTVFFLCGLWHGASLSFIAWGLYHGGFLVLERVGLNAKLERAPAILRHAYVILVFAIGWVFFRAETFGQALDVLSGMFGAAGISSPAQPLQAYLDPMGQVALLAGLIGAAPWLNVVIRWVQGKEEQGRGQLLTSATRVVGLIALSGVFVLSAVQLAAGTYNPFIYFRF